MFLRYVLNTFLYYYLVTMIPLICCKIHCLYLSIFVWFRIRFIYEFLKRISICNTSIIHNKKRTPLLNLPTSCISGRLAPQTLSIKGKYTILFSDFLIIGLCNYSADSLFVILSFLTAPPKVFISKNL